MAALAPLEVILFVGGLITAAPMLLDLFPKKDNSNLITTCKLVSGSLDTQDGDLPALHLFDRNGATIGLSEGESSGRDTGLGKGGFKDVRIQQVNQQKSIADLSYLSVVNGGNDATCLALISCTTPSGLSYAFTGDIAQQCDGVLGLKVPWFYSNKSVAQPPGKGEVQPACVWIDGDATNGLTTQGLGIHMESFRSSEAREADFQENRMRMCLSKPRFGVYEKMDSFDVIPFFKESPFDPQTLLDIGDKALDQNNWGTTPMDVEDFFFGQFFRRDVNETASPSDEQEGDAELSQQLFDRQGNVPAPAGPAGSPRPNPVGKANAPDAKKSTAAQGGKSTAGQRASPQGKSTTAKGNGAKANQGKSTAGGKSTAAKGKGRGAKLITAKTQGTRRAYPKAGKLVMSSKDDHSAKKLCSSGGSWGPDFYSQKEGLFCDMVNKKTYPVCDKKTTTACFDQNTRKMRRGKGNSRRDVDGVLIPVKNYNDVQVW